MTSVPSETIFSEDPWLQRYRAEYERLPTLSSLPEADREAEYERREAIRKKLLSLPEAPVRDLRSDREKKIDDNRAALIADWILQRWNAEDLDAFHSWWLIDNFASDRLPQFLDADLTRRARNLVLQSSADGAPVAQKSDPVPSALLVEVIEGVVKAGMTNVLNEVAKTPAVNENRADEIDESHFDSTEKGIAAFDIGLELEKDHDAAKSWTRRFTSDISKRGSSLKSIGKCPNDGRKQLYRLDEILDEIGRTRYLSTKQKAVLSKRMQSFLRYPDTRVSRET